MLGRGVSVRHSEVCDTDAVLRLAPGMLHSETATSLVRNENHSHRQRDDENVGGVLYQPTPGADWNTVG